MYEVGVNKVFHAILFFQSNNKGSQQHLVSMCRFMRVGKTTEIHMAMDLTSAKR